MEFERIGKNTVQCHMTVEEMNEYGLRIEDFFTNQEKSRDFLEQLVERAEEEIGYEVESGMISMQLMRMPDDSLVITFSDRGEEGLQNMLSQIQNLAGMIDEDTAESLMEVMARETGATSEDEVHQEENMLEFEENPGKKNKSSGSTFRQHQKEAEKRRQERIRKNQSASRVYHFDSISPLEDFVANMEMQKTFPSKLYKDRRTGGWYLLIKKGKLKLEEYQTVCHRLMEYGELAASRPFMEQYCKEHFDCIIAKRALQTILEYVS